MMLMATMLLLLAASCSSRKKLVSPMAHAANYEWMSAKINGELTGESGEFPFSGTLRMRRDSAIWISASPMMGIESIRTRITQDSIIVVNRVEQSYLAEPFSEVAETISTPSLQELQAMLLGDGTSNHVEMQFGPYKAKIRYADIHWDEPTTFPIKINQKYERMKLKP